MAVERSRKSISDLMDIRPDCATVRRNGELITISPESVAIGEIIIVKPGRKNPIRRCGIGWRFYAGYEGFNWRIGSEKRS